MDRAAARRRLATFAAGSAAGSGTRRLRAAVIAGVPELARYRRAWDVVAVRPEDWVAELAAAAPDLLVVDACRFGNAGAWTYRVAWTSHPDYFGLRDLTALTEWCAAAGIPTVFRLLPGEDVDVADWAEAASLFDLVVAGDTDLETSFAALANRRGLVAVAPTVPKEVPAAELDAATVCAAIDAAAASSAAA